MRLQFSIGDSWAGWTWHRELLWTRTAHYVCGRGWV